MTITELAIDFFITGGAIVLACLSLTVRDIFTAIVLYISLGLLVTLCWARLGGWDVAIAEAAIGAGLTGALLLASAKQLSTDSDSDSDKTTTARKAPQQLGHSTKGQVNVH